MGKYFTPEEELYIRTWYGAKSYDQMARELGRTKHSVSHKALCLGLAVGKNPHKSRRAWTEEEIEYLLKKWGTQGGPQIARRLKRTIKSVHKKAQALKLSAYIGIGLTAKELGRCFSCDVRVIKRWISMGLPCTEVMRGELLVRHIREEDFWEWAAEHRQEVPWSAYLQDSILPEPDWVRQEIRKYATPNSRKPITNSQRVQIMRDYVEHNLKMADIALKYGRSKGSIRHILNDAQTQKAYESYLKVLQKEKSKSDNKKIRLT